MNVLDWKKLDSTAQGIALQRAPSNVSPAIADKVAAIIDAVRSRGDVAIQEFTVQFENVTRKSIRASEKELDEACQKLPAAMRSAIDAAYDNVQAFHLRGRPADYSMETVPGVTCSARYTGIGRAGMYAPGGATPLPSSVLMLGVPAQIAGCGKRNLCTAPNRNGTIDPAIAWAARKCSITEVFLAGGAQAIAAMAFGTETVPATDKIFGPGSVWVTEAKQQVARIGTVAIDMPAGPSEVMILADGTANATFVAADMLAQLEHGCDSQAILVTTDRNLAHAVVKEVERLRLQLTRSNQIEQSLAHSGVILVSTLDEATDIANRYAAEHLIIQTADPAVLCDRITSAGSIFLGAWTPEVLGDYCSGTNHVLPTNGFARCMNGLSVSDFMKRLTIQQATRRGLAALAPVATTLAAWEGLTAHALAITIRQAKESPIEP